MTGFAPISNAPAVGANSVVGASSGAQSAGAQGPSDFSSVLHATANVQQAAPAEVSDKSGVAAQPNSSRAPKASTAQSNSQPAVVQARINVPAAAPILVASVPAATAAPPVPPPVPPATAASLERLQAESESPAAASKIASAATNGTNDSILAQTDPTKNDPLNGSANASGDLSASQSTASADQSTALATEAEIAASISTALGAAAAGDRSQVGPAQTDAATASSAQHDSAASNATPATTSSAKPAATPELTLKFEPPQTVLPAQIPAAPKANAVPAAPLAGSASARNDASGRPITQAAAAEAVPANVTAANASLQKAISDARDKLVQALDANLQAEISAAPIKAISSANPANGEPGNPAGQNPANPSFNSSAQDLLKQSSDIATGVSTNASGNSSDLDALGTITSPSAVEKAAALVAAATDPTLHTLPDPAPQAPSIATTPTPPAVSTTSASGARPAPPPPSPLPQTLPPSLSDLAKASEMYQRAGGSEMHVAMETDLLGAVDLRATMHQSTLTATIGVQRADIQALLSNELPALQHALADKNLHVDQISVLNNSVGGRAGSGGQQEAPAQNRFAPRAEYPPIVAGAAASHAEDGPISMGAPSMAHLRSDDSSRISVHV